MILQADLQNIANEKRIRADIIDKDYVIGHFINHLYSKSWVRENLVFKGGTCLRKCYFNDYRFSEDLDFTLLNRHFEIKTPHLTEVCREVEKKTGIRFYVKPFSKTFYNDQLVGYETGVLYWGANHRKNTPPPHPNRWLTKIKFEAQSLELLCFPVEKKTVLHPYSDQNSMESQFINCYSLR